MRQHCVLSLGEYVPLPTTGQQQVEESWLPMVLDKWSSTASNLRSSRLAKLRSTTTRSNSHVDRSWWSTPTCRSRRPPCCSCLDCSCSVIVSNRQTAACRYCAGQ